MPAVLDELVDIYERATQAAVASKPLDTWIVSDSYLERWDFLPPLEFAEVLAFESDEEWACMAVPTPPPDDDYEEGEALHYRLVRFTCVDGRWLIQELLSSSVEAAFLKPGEDLEGALRARAAKEVGEERPPPPRTATFVPPETRPKTPKPECRAPRFASASIVRIESRAEDEDLREVEKKLGVTLPSCYREYVLAYGAAEYSSVLQVFLPFDLTAPDDRYLESRSYWRWDENEFLDAQAASECVRIGASEIAELVYHPGDPAALYVLPKHSRTIHQVGPTLDDALEWLCSSGELVPAFAARYVFDREYVEAGWAEYDGELEMDVVVEQLSELGLHEAQHKKDWQDEPSHLLLCPVIHGAVEISRRQGWSAPVVTISYDRDNAPKEPRQQLAAKLKEIGYQVRRLLK